MKAPTAVWVSGHDAGLLDPSAGIYQVSAYRWFGPVAGSLAVFSLLPLPIYYVNASPPAGSVLSMVWVIVAGIAVYRRVRDTQQ